MRNLGLVFIGILFGASISLAQSNDINFPTAITANVVEGTIKARVIADNRYTTHYYTFGGDQGDIFINVVTKNLDGDIDVFAVEGMRRLTTMLVYSDNPESETGRLIYLRRPERLLLRIQGRTPDDQAATYKIKFAGSFIALKATPDVVAVPVLPETQAGTGMANNTGGSAPAKSGTGQSVKPSGVPIADSDKKQPVTRGSDAGTKRTNDPSRDSGPSTSPKPPKPVDPLKNVRLVIEFKNGTRSDAPLSEIIRVSVEKGVLIVIRKNGSIERYPFIDVLKVNIE